MKRDLDILIALFTYLYNSKIEIVTQLKYLGVNFHINGRWNQTNKYIAEHALKAMHRLFCVFNKYEFSIKDTFKLFDVLVSPVLNYSSEVSGYFESLNIYIYMPIFSCCKTTTRT